MLSNKAVINPMSAKQIKNRKYFNMNTLQMINEKSKQAEETEKPVSKVVEIGFGHGSEKFHQALSVMTNDEKVELVKGILSAIKIFHSPYTTEMKEAKELLIEAFGQSELKKLPKVRPMFTLDSECKSLRGWYASFGSVMRKPLSGPLDHFHFNSNGHGLFFCAWSDDPNSLESFAKKLTRGMLEWNSYCGTLWAGWDRN